MAKPAIPTEAPAERLQMIENEISKELLLHLEVLFVHLVVLIHSNCVIGSAGDLLDDRHWKMSYLVKVYG